MSTPAEEPLKDRELRLDDQELSLIRQEFGLSPGVKIFCEELTGQSLVGNDTFLQDELPQLEGYRLQVVSAQTFLPGNEPDGGGDGSEIWLSHLRARVYYRDLPVFLEMRWYPRHLRGRVSLVGLEYEPSAEHMAQIARGRALLMYVEHAGPGRKATG